jgi:hypothetical protein
MFLLSDIRHYQYTLKKGLAKDWKGRVTTTAYYYPPTRDSPLSLSPHPVVYPLQVVSCLVFVIAAPW